MMMLHHHVQAVKGAKAKRKTKVVKMIQNEKLKAARLVVKQDIARNNTVWVTGILTPKPPKRLLEQRFAEFGTVVSVTVHSKWSEEADTEADGAADEGAEAEPAGGSDERDAWALVSFSTAAAMEAAVKMAASVGGLQITDEFGLTYRLDVQDTKTMRGLEEEDVEELAVMWREQKREISSAVKIQAVVRGRNSRKKALGSIAGEFLVQEKEKRSKSTRSTKSMLNKANLQKQQGSDSEQPPDVAGWVQSAASDTAAAGSTAQAATGRRDRAVSSAGRVSADGGGSRGAAADEARPPSAEKQAAIAAAQKKAAEMAASNAAAARQQQRQQQYHEATAARPGSGASSVGGVAAPAVRTGVRIGHHEFLSTELNSQLRVGKHSVFKLSGQRFASAARAVRAEHSEDGDGDGDGDAGSGGAEKTGGGGGGRPASRELTAQEKAVAERRAKKKKMLLDMAPKGLAPAEIAVGMLVKVIGDLTAKGYVVEHRKTRVRVDFSSTGGPSSKWIECNLKTLLFNLEPGKTEQLVGSWARSGETLGIVVDADDGEGNATLRLGDGTKLAAPAGTVKRARPTAAVLAECFWERGSHARVGERLGVIISRLIASKVSSEGKRVRMLWTDTGQLSDSTIETSRLEPVWQVPESRRIVRGWCKVGSFVRYSNGGDSGGATSRLGVVCAHTFATQDPAKLVVVRWADGGSDNIPGAPDRWLIGQGPASLSPCRPTQEEVAREWWRVGSIAKHGQSKLGMVVRAAEIEHRDPSTGEAVDVASADGEEGAYVKIIWSDGTPSGGKWKRGMPRGSVNVTAIKPAYSDEDVMAAVAGWCRPAAFVRHHGQLCEVISHIDTTDNSVQIRYAGPAKANRSMVATRTTPGSGTAWVAELTPAQVEGFPLWIWDTSPEEISPGQEDAQRERARMEGGAHGRPSTAGSGTMGGGGGAGAGARGGRPSTAGSGSTVGMARDYRGFDYGAGRIEMPAEGEAAAAAKEKLKLPGKLNMYVGRNHPRYDKAVRASSPTDDGPGNEGGEQAPPPVVMLEDDDELSAMAAEAREAQSWLANMRQMLAEEQQAEAEEKAAAAAAPAVTTHFARDEWGAPIAQDAAEQMYLERRIKTHHAHSSRRDSLSSAAGSASEDGGGGSSEHGGSGYGGAGGYGGGGGGGGRSSGGRRRPGSSSSSAAGGGPQSSLPPIR
jgi:hypothetical protein